MTWPRDAVAALGAGDADDAILTRTSETLEPIYDEFLEQTRAADSLNIDETGWYLSGEPRTLWGAFSKQTAVLRIAPDRGKQRLHGLSERLLSVDQTC
jgi:Transposase IS66 family